MANPERFTQSILFRNFPWYSKHLAEDTWRDAELNGQNDFLQTMKRIDTEGYPPINYKVDDREFRDLLSLSSFDFSSQAAPSTAAYACWTTLLRFQILDLFLSMYGVSTEVTPKRPPPQGKAPIALLRALAKWPSHLKTLEAQISQLILPSEQDVQEKGPLALERVFASIVALLDMPSQTILQKTEKNLQAMGAAMAWIILCDAMPYDIHGRHLVTSGVEGLPDFFQVKLKSFTVKELLQPLSFGVNSSLLVAACNMNLSNSHGSIPTQYQMRSFLGRCRTPKLAHVERAFFDTVLALSAGKPVRTALIEHLCPALSVAPDGQSADTRLFLDGESGAGFIHTPVPQDVPELETMSPKACIPLDSTPQACIPMNSTQAEHRTPGMPMDNTSSLDEMPNRDEDSGSSSAELQAMGPNSGLLPSMRQEPPPEGMDMILGASVAPVQLSDSLMTSTSTDKDSSSNASAQGSAIDIPVDSMQPCLKTSGDVIMSDSPLSSPALSAEDDGDPRDVVEIVVEKNPPLTRRSVRLKGGKSSDFNPPEEAGRKRKRPVEQSQPKIPKKKRKTCSHHKDYKQLNLAPCLCPVEADPPERSRKPIRMSGYRPDGVSKREFDLVLHTATEHVERPMLEGIQRSMNAFDEKYLKGDGPRFRHHIDGILPTGPAANDEYDLYVIDVKQWDTLSSSDRVALWGTGCDIFITGLGVTGPHVDVEEKLSTLHRLDQPMEVQVPGLRNPVSDGDEIDGDYTQCIRTTTLRTVLHHAKRADGLVLNGLQLPASHTVQPNPLAGRQVFNLLMCSPTNVVIIVLSGLDLEDVAYRQTLKLYERFRNEHLPIEQEYWQIFGTAHTLSISHLDMAATRITVVGPGEKLWMRRLRLHRDIGDSYAFSTWDPDKPDLTGRYEGVILSPGAGTLLMQDATEHIVVGLTPSSDSNAASSSTIQTNPQLMATLITGGHFVAASTIRNSLCTLLHLVMMEYVLTNVEHDGRWQIFGRISAFWMDLTSKRPVTDRDTLRAYIPRLSDTTAEGWMDIICVACVMVLATPFDRRHYSGKIPSRELNDRTVVHDTYKEWRQWFAKSFVGTRNGVAIDWERDVFSRVLLNLALVLTRYHKREYVQDSPDLLLCQKNNALAKQVKFVLDEYSSELGPEFLQRLAEEDESKRFFLLDGHEIAIYRK
ncbi:hypothetical protein DFH06DRAFT_1350064 [Mycena polygramma]|nr:hypothetical protein DFH06DRAFT_1350064 [Mycena polygramma]